MSGFKVQGKLVQEIFEMSACNETPHGRGHYQVDQRPGCLLGGLVVLLERVNTLAVGLIITCAGSLASLVALFRSDESELGASGFTHYSLEACGGELEGGFKALL